MDKLIPDYLQNDVVFFSVQEKLGSGADGVDVVILKNNGEFLELSSGVVLDSVKLTSRVECAKKITTYYNGDLKKYYLVWIGSSLYVVEKNQKLWVHQIVENVRDLKIADYHRAGYPQVVLKTDSRKEPMILDFQKSQIVYDRSLCLPVLEKDCLFLQVQRVKLEIKKAQRYLEKRKNLTSRVIANIDSKLFESMNSMQTDDCALSVVGDPIVLLIFDNVIIVIEVNNSLTKEVSQVELQVLSPTKSCRSVLLKENLAGCSDVEDFHVGLSLPPNSSGYLIGTLGEVQLCVPEILCSGTLSYSILGEVEAHCKKLNFKPVNIVEQLRMYSHEPIKLPENMILVGLIATAIKQIINIEFFDYCCFPDLFSKLGFQKFCKNYVLYPIWSSNFLKGMLIKIYESNDSPDSCKVSLCIYGRDNAQLDMFNRLFYSDIQNENVLRFSKKENDLLTLKRISEEMNCIKSLLVSSQTKKYTEFKLDYLKFSECEKNTDVVVDHYDKERYIALKYINV